MVIARSAVALPLDSAQIFAFPGRPVIKSVDDFEKVPDRSAMQMRLAHSIVGESVPKDAIGKTQPGDLVAELSDVGAGDLTVCVIGFHGDLSDPKFQHQIQAHSHDLAMKCEVASGTDRAIVVEAPPQKRFD